MAQHDPQGHPPGRGSIVKAPWLAAWCGHPPLQRTTCWLRAALLGREEGPRRLSAEERLRRRCDACPGSSASLRFDPPNPGPDQAKLPLHDYLARAGYPAVKKKRGFWDASWQAWNTNLTRQAKRAEEVSRLEKRAARAAGAVGAPDETRLRPARPASTRCTHV